MKGSQAVKDGGADEQLHRKREIARAQVGRRDGARIAVILTTRFGHDPLSSHVMSEGGVAIM